MEGREVERRLAVVMVVDVVGYSRLVETDENAALEAVRTLKEAILTPFLTRHGAG